MTAAELRSLAERSRRIAAWRERAAADLDGVARSLRGVTEAVVARSRAAWSCPAAIGFEAQIAAQRRRVDDAARDVGSASGRLRVIAERLRAEARSLEAEAEAIESATLATAPL